MKRSLQSFKMQNFQYVIHGGHVFEAALRNMYLLGHLSLQGDEIPSCMFTYPRLQSLEIMELHGNVKWDDIILAVNLLRKVRPNVVQLKMHDTNEVPKIIKQQLVTILFGDYQNRRFLPPTQSSCKLLFPTCGLILCFLEFIKGNRTHANRTAKKPSSMWRDLACFSFIFSSKCSSVKQYAFNLFVVMTCLFRTECIH